MKQLLFAITLGLLLASCDDHKDFPDTATKVGHVLCTDGKVMTVDDCEAQGKRPIAVVFHTGQREDIEGEGYAVYLWDLAPVAFADTLGIAQGTSADIAALDGNTNTYALYGKEKVCSPLAWAVFDLWRYGQSAYVASGEVFSPWHSTSKLGSAHGLSKTFPLLAKCGSCSRRGTP